MTWEQVEHAETLHYNFLELDQKYSLHCRRILSREPEIKGEVCLWMSLSEARPVPKKSCA